MKNIKTLVFAALAGLTVIGSAEAMPIAAQSATQTVAAPVIKTAVVTTTRVVRGRRPMMMMMRRRPMMVTKTVRRVVR